MEKDSAFATAMRSLLGASVGRPNDRPSSPIGRALRYLVSHNGTKNPLGIANGKDGPMYRWALPSE
jgi:hypothetical protein